MLVPILFLAVALLMIFFEFYLPGGVLGVLGGALYLASIVMVYLQVKSLSALLLFICIAAIALVFVIKFALWRIRKSKSHNTLYHNDDQEGYCASSFEASLVGVEGTAFSDLRPSGYILVNGQRYQATSKEGYLVKGTSVVVVDGAGAHLIVKQKKDKE